MVHVNAEYLNYTATLCGEVKDASYEMAGIAGETSRRLDVLDVGCGIGVDTTAIARYVAPGSRVVGVDVDPAMISAAVERARSLGLEGVEHLCLDAGQVDFAGEFDVVRAERLFQHLGEPSRVLGNMVRAARPGGRVLIVDTDWSTLRCSAFDEATNDAIARAYSEKLTFGPNLDVFAELFQQHGLRHVAVRTIGVRLDHDDYMKASKFPELVGEVFDGVTAERLSAMLATAPRHDNFAAIDVVLITGVVP